MAILAMRPITKNDAAREQRAWAGSPCHAVLKHDRLLVMDCGEEPREQPFFMRRRGAVREGWHAQNMDVIGMAELPWHDFVIPHASHPCSGTCHPPVKASNHRDLRDSLTPHRSSSIVGL